MKIALCVGHSRKVRGRPEGGAVSAGGVSEWDYNSLLARAILRRLVRCHEVTVVDDYGGRGYTAAMKWLGERLKSWGADVAVELHFNASDGSASGHEWLHWDGSKAGKKLALAFHMAHSQTWPWHKGRGCKPISPVGRGAGFLMHTPCPAVIAEPFFGDHGGDWRQFGPEIGREALAEVMAAALMGYGKAVKL